MAIHRSTVTDFSPVCWTLTRRLVRQAGCEHPRDIAFLVLFSRLIVFGMPVVMGGIAAAWAALREWSPAFDRQIETLPQHSLLVLLFALLLLTFCAPLALCERLLCRRVGSRQRFDGRPDARALRATADGLEYRLRGALTMISYRSVAGIVSTRRFVQLSGLGMPDIALPKSAFADPRFATAFAQRLGEACGVVPATS